MPRLVPPAVAGDLVPGRAQARERVRIQLAVEPLEEERRPQVLAREQAEQLRQALADGEVLAERLALRPRPALELRGLAEVVERDGDRGHRRSVARTVSRRRRP